MGAAGPGAGPAGPGPEACRTGAGRGRGLCGTGDRIGRPAPSGPARDRPPPPLNKARSGGRTSPTESARDQALGLAGPAPGSPGCGPPRSALSPWSGRPTRDASDRTRTTRTVPPDRNRARRTSPAGPGPGSPDRCPPGPVVVPRPWGTRRTGPRPNAPTPPDRTRHTNPRPAETHRTPPFTHAHATRLAPPGGGPEAARLRGRPQCGWGCGAVALMVVRVTISAIR